MTKDQIKYLERKFGKKMSECKVIEENGEKFIYHEKDGISSRFDTVDSFVRYAKPAIPDEPIIGEFIPK